MNHAIKPSGNELAVKVSGLTRRFRGKVAVDDVDLQIPAGQVFGLVGVNGSGKTTLIRHLIGGLMPQSGSVRVLGLDPIADRVDVLRRTGYLTEEDTLPRWMRVGELLDFYRGVQPNWDQRFAGELCDMFRLDRTQKLSSLSKGGRARVGLLAAIAHRPELLILDEPSSGLDPIARGEILETVIRTVNDDGRTVLFSSHLLDEVDRVCDRVALIHGGRIIEEVELLSLGQQYEEVVGRSDGPEAPLGDSYASFGYKSDGQEWSVLRRTDDSINRSETDPSWVSRPATLSRWFDARVSQQENRIPQESAS
ncbi:ABC transporter ATP-binding protein [Crateriforma conspicua]|uniref:ABC transporter ATP-binding protein YtrB n=1 Tax=Crateriforma conspicua TaxID=2527996 RepID=A0A5C5Y228_9PLAN|nr:ABC transporter ATP-binding protein [Crateriforma conspicua]TWT69677.1 ABC transporter ATP-binding protein YtrB [Crateriforma conspicua]